MGRRVAEATGGSGGGLEDGFGHATAGRAGQEGVRRAKLRLEALDFSLTPKLHPAPSPRRRHFSQWQMEERKMT